MKILVTAPDYYPKEILSELEPFGHVDSKKLSREELMKIIGNYDAILARIEIKFDRELLEKADNLKAIATATTGTDHIDLEYAKERGIKVISAPGANAIATAEHTFGMILSLVRNIPWGFESIKNFEYKRSEFLGSELNGKTIGIIGFGRIGCQVGRYAKTFGMKILTYDPYINENLARDIGAEIVPLDKLLKDSDIISIHAFASPENENMISNEQFSKMKKTAFLINVSRGSLVDEDALIDALKTNKIQGAALDVLKEEPPSRSNNLIDYAKRSNNLIITPHLGGSTKESVYNAAKEVVQKVKEILIKQ
ncbi:MAG: hydroxyacid dehydrogenase [Candidatus Aenigmarchaeota archaeon]|nr:hydroxyacid dehydrogenase [Candidatus Aenigmarchaeota archaeon]